MQYKKYTIVSLKLFAIVVVGITLYACSPKVEDVLYTQYSNRSKNDLTITVNTKRGLFTGREGFFNFKRDEYLFTFDIKSKTYTERDMEIRIWRGKVFHLRPKHGTVTLLDNPSGGILVIVDISDESIPKLVNGKYKLRMAGSDGEHIWYKM
jgi:hypothetical protein